LAGVFRRRELVPFVMVPRHVSNIYDATDSLSLMARLQHAQEAFVYGVPLAALALMRAILEQLMKKHYGWNEKGLLKSIEVASARGLFPPTILFSQVQRLLKLGNDAVHLNSEELHKVAEADVEKEILSLLLIIRTLIEGAPKTSS